MQIYRRCHPATVISFDLDDTLYNNVPIIIQAETKLLSFVNNKLTQFKAQPLSTEQWFECKQAFSNAHPKLAHDVTALRHAFLTDLFSQHKVASAKALAQQAYQLFIQYRNNFTVDKLQVDLLLRLKKRYRLIAITNGNADPNLIGLNGIFEQVLRPENDIKMKPAADLFKQASTIMQVPLSQIVHVGDSEYTDVAGAITSGCQAVWFNQDNRPYKGRILPSLQVSSIEQLVVWLLNTATQG